MNQVFKFSFLLIFASILFASCGPIGNDFLDEDMTCIEFCDSAEVSPFFQNGGDCMSLCQTCNNPSDSPATTAVCFCNWYEGYLNAEGISWKDIPNSPGNISNKGQCVKFFKNAFEGGTN